MHATPEYRSLHCNDSQRANMEISTDQPRDRTQPRRIHTARPSLDSETRSHVNTETAAWYVNRRPQTLRAWACYEACSGKHADKRNAGVLRPVRVNGRLAWEVASIRAALGIVQ